MKTPVNQHEYWGFITTHLGPLVLARIGSFWSTFEGPLTQLYGSLIPGRLLEIGTIPHFSPVIQKKHKQCTLICICPDCCWIGHLNLCSGASLDCHTIWLSLAIQPRSNSAESHVWWQSTFMEIVASIASICTSSKKQMLHQSSTAPIRNRSDWFQKREKPMLWESVTHEQVWPPMWAMHIRGHKVNLSYFAYKSFVSLSELGRETKKWWGP